MTAVTHMKQPPMWKWAGSFSAEALPETAFVHAFILAICAWAARASGARRMAIPTGAVDADELRRVVLALMAAKADKRS
jgi:hypothetical protein